MKKTLAIARHEFKQTLKRKAFILMTIGLPVLLMLGYGIYEGVQHWVQTSENGGEIRQIGYVDYDGRFNEDRNQGSITFFPYYSEEMARIALLAGEIEEYIVIPDDYVSSGMVYRYTTERELELPGGVWSSTKDFLLANLVTEEVSPELMERIRDPLGISTTMLDKGGEPASDQDGASRVLLPIAFGMLFMFAIFFSSGSLLDSVTEEKENRVIEVLLSSVSSRQLLVGKVLGLGAAGLLQIIVWLASLKVFTEVVSVNIPLLSGLSIPFDLLIWGIVYFILGYLFFAALYAGVGSIVPTSKDGQALSFAIVMPATLPLVFNMLIIRDPEGILPRVLTFFPLTAPTTSMMRLSVHAMSAWEVALSLAVLAAAVVLTIWIAAKTFRTYLLMYGKRPALKEIVRSIRAA